MKKIIVRTVIILFALPFVIAFGVIAFVDEHDPEKLCNDAANEVEKNPSIESVEAFMNVSTDGEYSYLHLALFGRLFAQHPDLFREVYEANNTSNHLYYEDLRHLGDGIFEYYPDLEPANFDEVYKNCKWLTDSSDTKDKQPSSPITWIIGDRSLQEYKELHPNKNIIAFFTMEKWDTIGLMQLKLLEELPELEKLKTNTLFIRYNTDLRDDSDYGGKEMKKRGIHYLPCFLVIGKGKETFTPNPNKFSSPIEEFKTDIKTRLELLK